MNRTLLLAGLVLGLGTAVQAQDEPKLEDGIYAKVDTSMGSMTLRLYHDKVPQTVASFVALAEGKMDGTGRDGPYYDGLTFHRIMKGFMIQGGCPKGRGDGGPGYRFQDETRRDLKHDGPGVLSMANSDKGKAPYSNTGRTNGSQFFITLEPTAHLDGLHTVFGKLIAGQDVLTKIGDVQTDRTNNRPIKPVTINKVRVLRIGDAAKAWDPRRKSLDEPKGEPDPKKLPKKGQKARPRATVNLIVLQYKECERDGVPAAYTQQAAVELAKGLVDRARRTGASFEALARRYSDLRAVRYLLIKKHNDASLAPCYTLQPGQVSDAFVTPYGVMVAEGVK